MTALSLREHDLTRATLLRRVALPTAILLLAAGLAVPAPPAHAAGPAGTDYTQYVDPFIGTEDDFGQDGPGAFVPHGIAKITTLSSPRSHTGYDHKSTTIKGFTAITLDGVGGNGAGGDFLVSPTYQTYTARPSTSSYDKAYTHENESASPGYYQVGLTESGKAINARATADTRTGVQDFTFASAGRASLVIDLANNFGTRQGGVLTVGTTADGKTSLAGTLKGFFYNSNYTLHYYAETTVPAATVSTWGSAGLSATRRAQSGTDIGAILGFNVAAGAHVGLKVTLSPISPEQAERDMKAEIGQKSFDEVRAAATAEWNETLGVVEVEAGEDDDPTGDLKTMFYTHLFRMSGSPINATSTDGTYRGVDGRIYSAAGSTHYDSWSLWDDFRKYSSIAAVYPDVYRDITQSLVDLFAEMTNSGAGSVGSLMQSVPTVRWERAAVVIADAINKGVDLKRLDAAYPSLVRNSNGNYNSSNEALGFIPGGVAETVGTSYDDWAMYVIASKLGKTADAARFLKRSTNYVNLFNTAALTTNAEALASRTGVEQVGLLMPRTANGWTPNVDPERFEPSGAGLYQGTLWQYNWYDAQDMGGMIALMGGKTGARTALSYLFGEQEPANCKRMLHSNANEIDLQSPYLFNYVGAPSRTQYWARNIIAAETCNRYIATGSTGEAPSGGGEFTTPAKMLTYRNHPQGFLPTMDNDAATMSSVYVSGALGLFPVTSGADSYQIGSPLFEKTTIHYPGGKDFVIEASGVNADSYFIQDATLNGEELDRTWLTFDELASGGVLHFDMGGTASGWGENSPMAYSMSDELPSSVYDPTSVVATATQVFEESAANDGSIGNAVTVTATPGFAGQTGADLTAQVTATGLPDGLSIVATRAEAGALALTLAGKAVDHLVDDSTDGVTVTLAEDAFAGPAPSAEDRTLALKLRFSGYTITPSTTTVTAGPDATVDATIELALSGGATFAGRTGDDLPEDAASFAGLDSGLTAVLRKTAATTAELTLTGSLSAEVASTFILTLADSALAGAAAAQVSGRGTTVVDPFRIAPASTTRADLQELYDEARLVTADHYSAGSFSALQAAVGAAKVALADAEASEHALAQALANLRGAVDGLVISDGGYRLLQAESYDLWSGGSLKTEAGGTGTNVGGTSPGSWLAYRGLDFSERPLGAVAIAYSHNPGSASANSRIELRTGSQTGALVATIPLPTTNGWANYSVLTHTFTDPERTALSGVNDVYLVLLGSQDKAWVANLDYFQFLPDVVAAPTELLVEFEKLAAANGLFDADPALLAGTDYRNGDNGGAASQNQLKTEAANGGRILAGVTTGAWVRYAGIDLGARKASTLKVTYDAPTNRVADARVAVHLDSMTGAPLVEQALPNTGSAWGGYSTISIELPTAVTGSHTLYFSFTSTPTGSLPYAGNFDSFALVYDEESSAPFEFRQLTPNNLTVLGPNLGRDGPAGAYTNFGNTHNEEWVRYSGVEFGPNGADMLSISYDKPNNDRSIDKTWIEVRLGSATGETVAATPMLARTGAGWGTYLTTSISVDPEIFSGTKDVFFVFRMNPVNTNQSNPYVANVKWFQFADSTAAGGTQKTVQFESIRSGTGLLSAAGLVSGTDYSGADLKTEVAGSIGQLAGTKNGTWVRYPNVNVGANVATSLSVTYDAPGDKAIAPQLAIHVGSMSEHPFVVAALPNTAVSGWGTYQTVTIPLPTEVTGNNALYFEFRSTPTSSAPYVANLDSFTLGYGVDKASLRATVAELAPLADDKARYLAADFGVFARALATARAVVADPSATSAEVTVALRTLTLAANGLEWKVVKQLADWVVKAEAVDESGVTPQSYAALRLAVTTAEALKPDENSHEEYEAALAGLAAAYHELAGFAPSLTAPSEPVQPGSEVEFAGTGFAPGEVVTFSWIQSPPLTVAWTASANGSGDVATTVTVPGTTIDGSYGVEAVGTVSAAPVTATVAVRLVRTASTTSFLGVPAEVTEGDPVPVTVGVTSGASGTVELFDADTTLGTLPLVNSTADFVVPSLTVGSHTLTAVYSGSDRFLPSTSAAVTISVKARTVPPAPTITLLAPVLSQPSQVYGAVTERRATVTSVVVGAKSGKVTFLTGSKVLGTATITTVGRISRATLRLPATLAIGTHTGLSARLVTTGGKTVTSRLSAVGFEVVKASTSRVAVTAARFRKGTKPKLKVEVAALSSGYVATGKVRIYVGKKLVKTVSLTSRMKGRVSVTLPKRYSSKIQVKATYVPSNTRTVESKTSKVLTVRTR